MSQGLEVLVFLFFLVCLVLSGGFFYSSHFSMALPYEALARLAGPLRPSVAAWSVRLIPRSWARLPGGNLYTTLSKYLKIAFS